MTECGSSCYAEQSAAWRAVCASSYYLVLPVLHILDGTLRRVLVGEGDKGKPLVLLGVLVLGQPHLPSNLIRRTETDAHYNSIHACSAKLTDGR